MTDNPTNRNRQPVYSYVPGGPFPHPISNPAGHSFGRRHEPGKPIAGDAWQACRSYVEGIDLFNHGYYWEAHEAWETQWHAEGRKGPIADVLKALIKLAASGVKVREGQPAGVITHARRAQLLLEQVARESGSRLLGLDLIGLAKRAAEIAERPPEDTAGKLVPVAVVFGFQITPE